MARNSLITREQKDTFLEVYRKTRSQQKAAVAAGRTYVGFYSLRKNNEEFRAEFEIARSELFEKLEEEAIRRAYDGVEVGKFYQGKLIATEREYSDRMLQFLLERGWPERFAPTIRNEITGKDGKALIPDNDVSANEIARRVAFLLQQGTLVPQPEDKPEEPAIH